VRLAEAQLALGSPGLPQPAAVAPARAGAAGEGQSAAAGRAPPQPQPPRIRPMTPPAGMGPRSPLPAPADGQTTPVSPPAAGAGAQHQAPAQQAGPALIDWSPGVEAPGVGPLAGMCAAAAASQALRLQAGAALRADGGAAAAVIPCIQDTGCCGATLSRGGAHSEPGAPPAAAAREGGVGGLLPCSPARLLTRLRELPRLEQSPAKAAATQSPIGRGGPRRVLAVAAALSGSLHDALRSLSPT
jgi:hypothetical protein